ncbi:Thyroid transcription factor 1-associated protein 26 [Varanus komodoensis]|nr:Thyroid transcription factor 1-associated protein 26 [Varanus komodoensis]
MRYPSRQSKSSTDEKETAVISRGGSRLRPRRRERCFDDASGATEEAEWLADGAGGKELEECFGAEEKCWYREVTGSPEPETVVETGPASSEGERSGGIELKMRFLCLWQSVLNQFEIRRQGFAFWRKQKIQHDYKKLLKKVNNAKSQKNIDYTDKYPEHLKHLYLAEEEMLKKQRRAKNNGPVVQEGKDTAPPKSSVIQRKPKMKTSNQKAKLDYEKIKAAQDEKKEAARKRREEREKAQKLYKQKKMEAYKILSKRTRKGQPNLNLQMEYLLQKIQQNP